MLNHKTVSRIIRENGLQVRPLRRFLRTTDSDHDGPILPNLARNLPMPIPMAQKFDRLLRQSCRAASCGCGLLSPYQGSCTDHDLR